MADRPIVRFVDVAIEKDTPSVSAAGFGTPLVITNNFLLSQTRRVRSFTTDDSVGEFFGYESDEYKMAVAYYNQDPFNANQPDVLMFGKYADSCTSALLEMGDSPQTDITVWQAVTDGGFFAFVNGLPVSISGCDFSNVTSLDDVAEVINLQIDNVGGNATLFFNGGRFNLKSKIGGTSSTIEVIGPPAAPGTDISGTGFLDGDTEVSPTNPGGSYISSPGAGTCPSLVTGQLQSGEGDDEIGNLLAVSDAAFKIVLNGVDYNITDIDLTAAIPTAQGVTNAINDAINQAIRISGMTVNVTWDGGAEQMTFANTSPTGSGLFIDYLLTADGDPGTDISGDGFLNATELDADSLDTQGIAAETPAEALEAIEVINNDWYAMSAIARFRDSSVTRTFADEIESRRKIFIIETNDANTLVLGSTSTVAYYVKEANYKRTGFFYYANEELYPVMAWLGLQLPKDIGSTNWAYKELPGIAEGALADIDPIDLTEAQKDAALDVNVNVYTETLGASFTYFGTMGGGRNVDKDGEYIDIVRNIDFLQARVEEGLLSLLLERDIIPYTNAGISIVDNRLLSLLDTYGVKQGILVTGSVVTSFPTRAETSQTDRDDRLLPDGTFQAQLQGGINVIIVRGTVFI